jgi:hypothetical protein
MSVAIATMGYFNPSIGTGVVDGQGIGGGGGGYYEEVKKKPVILIRNVESKTKQKPIINIIEVEIL